ncbi:NIPSNAP family protein [Chitinimonas naiadis]
MLTPSPFPVIEFRRYTLQAGCREHFVRYFETYFPEAFQQLGAMALGQGLDAGNAAGFTWLRGFRDMETRAIANAAFYYGPVWREHRTTLNNLIVDSDNVLLLRPWQPERGIPLLAAVNPVHEPAGAQGVLVAQLFAVRQGGLEAAVEQAERYLSQYREVGAQECGLLVTLDAANNFPQLPVRSDGPYLLWLGLMPSVASVEQALKPLAAQATQALIRADRLRGTPELQVLQTTPRSRLRWLPA